MRILICLILLLPNLLSAQDRVQHSFYLHDLSDSTDVNFNEVFEKYKLDESKPTVLIGYFSSTCGICRDMIYRYNMAKSSKYNLITALADGVSTENRDTIINGKNQNQAVYVIGNDELEQFKEINSIASTATNLYLYSKKGSLETQIEIKQFPFIVVFDENLTPLFFSAGFIFPNQLFNHVFKEKGQEYYSGSEAEVINNYFEQCTSDTLTNEKISEIKEYIQSKIEKVKNNEHVGYYYVSKEGKNDFSLVKSYFCLSKVYYVNNQMDKSKSYMDLCIQEFEKEKEKLKKGWNDFHTNSTTRERWRQMEYDDLFKPIEETIEFLNKKLGQ